MNNNVDIPVLYHSKTSVCSQKVRLVLAELDVDWHGQVLDLKKGQQFTPDYRALNPKASVPTYIDNDVCLTESNDIMMHLAASVEEGGDFSLNTDINDAIKEWMVESVRFHSAVHVLTTLALNRAKLLNLPPEELFLKLDRTPDKARAQRINDVVQNGLSGFAASSAILFLKNIYHKIDAKLAQNEFLSGETLSLADFAILPFVMRIRFLQLTPDWSGEQFSSLNRWVAQLQERRSFDAAVMQFHGAEALEKYKIQGAPVREELMKL
ncbi:MAG: glutathione S-transferase family protein [Rhizobiaceae bacterium]|nr:glutathione S-transferase family protein [Rhizobiaceae bacterium]